MGSAVYLDKAPEITIENGVVCFHTRSNGEAIPIYMPLLEFRKSLAGSIRLIAEYDARGTVVPMRRRKKG